MSSWAGWDSFFLKESNLCTSTSEIDVCVQPGGVHAYGRLPGGFPGHHWGVRVGEHPVVSLTVPHYSLQKINQRNVQKKKEKTILQSQFRGVVYFCAHVLKANIFPGPDIMGIPSATRLAAGFHRFARGIFQAKLANYGFYWTKLNLFLVLIGWDDLIRLLYKSSLVNRGASYLQNSPVPRLGGSFYSLLTTDIWVVGPVGCRGIKFSHSDRYYLNR